MLTVYRSTVLMGKVKQVPILIRWDKLNSCAALSQHFMEILLVELFFTRDGAKDPTITVGASSGTWNTNKQSITYEGQAGPVNYILNAYQYVSDGSENLVSIEEIILTVKFLSI